MKKFKKLYLMSYRQFESYRKLKSEKCNGWTNYPTWHTVVYLENIKENEKIIDKIEKIKNDKTIDIHDKILPIRDIIEKYINDLRNHIKKQNIYKYSIIDSFTEYAIDKINIGEIVKHYLNY